MSVYYQRKGDLENPVFSHSLLCLLDPTMGGHPKKVTNFLLNESEQKYSKSLETGSLLHEWIEREGTFAVEELDKPTDKLAALSEAFYDLYFLENWKNDIEAIRFMESNLVFQLEEQFTINKLYNIFFEGKPTSDEFNLFARCILYARIKVEFNKQLTTPKVLEKFEKECIPYIKFLKESNGKMILDKVTKNILMNCYQSIKQHETANALLELCQEKEVEFFWEEDINGTKLLRKAKIDRFHINSVDKIVTILDLKTTSKPATKFNDLLFGAFYQYKLGRQLVNYKEALISTTDLFKDYQFALYNIVVETFGDYVCCVYKLSGRSTQVFEYDLYDIKNRAVYHIKHNKWEMTREEYENGVIQI